MMLDGASYDDCDYMLGVDKNCCSDKEGSSNEQLLSTDEPTGWAEILLLSIRPWSKHYLDYDNQMV